MDSLLVTLCQLPPPKCVVFQYLDVAKFHAISALHCKYNMILSKLPHLSTQDGSQDSLSIQAEWLAKFWFMQKSGEFEKLSAETNMIQLTYPWQWFTNTEGREESTKLSCTIKEVTGALSESCSLELEQILEQAKITEQNKIVFFRYTIFLIAINHIVDFVAFTGIRF